MPTALTSAQKSFIEARTPYRISMAEAKEIASDLARSPSAGARAETVLQSYASSFTPAALSVFKNEALRLGAAVNTGPSATLQARIRATAEASDVVRSQITRVRSEISILESAHGTKEREVRSLIAQIEWRKKEVEDNYDRKRNMGLVFAMFGYSSASLVSLASALGDDSRLKSLNAQLSTLQREQRSIAADLRAYSSTKDRLESALATLQRTETSMLRNLAAPATPVTGALAPVSAAAHRLLIHEDLLANVRTQLGTLIQLRDAAAQIGGRFDSLISSCRATLVEAEKAAAASRKEFEALMKIALADDPDAAAIDWARRTVNAEVRAAVSTSIGRLVAESFPNGGPLAAELRKRLVDATLRAFQPA